MALQRLQEAVNQGACYLYYGISYLGVLAQELQSIRDPLEKKEPASETKPKKVEKVGNKPQFGVCSYLPDLLRYKDQVIPLLSELKVKWLRTDFPYSLWQSHREIFEVVDEIVEETRRRGIQMLPVLGTWTTGSSRPPRNREGFLQYIEEVVNRYNGKIGNYEFWNEPDCIWFWKSSIGEFSSLMDAAAKRAKSVNSQIKIGMNVAWHYSPTQPWALRFTQKVAQRGGLHHIDFIGLHGYPGTWEPGGATTWGKRIQDTKKLLRDMKEDKELWVTEFGYYAFKNQLLYPHTPYVQTKFLKESFNTIAEAGEVPVAIWYCLQDPLTLSNLNMQKTTYQEYGFGLYTRRLEPKDPTIARVIMEIAS